MTDYVAPVLEIKILRDYIWKRKEVGESERGRGRGREGERTSE